MKALHHHHSEEDDRQLFNAVQKALAQPDENSIPDIKNQYWGQRKGNFYAWYESRQGTSPLAYRLEQWKLQNHVRIPASIKKAMELIKQNPASLREIALAAGYSGSRSFTTYFKYVTHQTPREYAKEHEATIPIGSSYKPLIEFKIAGIKECMLIYPAMPLEEIASAFDYNTISTFSTAFKNHTGETPETYRLRNLQESGIRFQVRGLTVKTMLELEKSPAGTTMVHVARKCGFNTISNLHVRFKNSFGIRASQYLQTFRRGPGAGQYQEWNPSPEKLLIAHENQRSFHHVENKALEQAKIYLAQTHNLPLMRVAELSGYNNYKKFQDDFIRYEGIAPHIYGNLQKKDRVIATVKIYLKNPAITQSELAKQAGYFDHNDMNIEVRKFLGMEMKKFCENLRQKKSAKNSANDRQHLSGLDKA